MDFFRLSCVVLVFNGVKLTKAAPARMTSSNEWCPTSAALLVHNMTKQEFEAGPVNNLITIIADLLNEYCSNNAEKCSLTSWNNNRDKFNSSDVKMNQDYPKEIDNNYLEVLLSATLHANSSAYVPNATMKLALVDHMSNLSLAVGRTVTYVVCPVNKKELVTEVDNTLNYIMIPVSFALLLLICFLACVLHRSDKHKIKEREKRKRAAFALQKKKDAESQTKTKQTQSTVIHHKAKSLKTIDDDIQETTQPLPTRREKSSRRRDREKTDSDNDKPLHHSKTTTQEGNSPHEDSSDPPTSRRHKKRSSRKHRSETNGGYVDEENLENPQYEDVKPRSDNTGESDAIEEGHSHRRKKKKSKRRHYRHSADEGYHEESNGYKFSPDLPPVVDVHAPLPRSLPPLTPVSPPVSDTKM